MHHYLEIHGLVYGKKYILEIVRTFKRSSKCGGN